MVEVAGIELAYARAEIAMSERIGEERFRVFDHLDGVRETLARLILAADELEHFGGPRRLTRKHIARLRNAKSQLRRRKQSICA